MCELGALALLSSGRTDDPVRVQVDPPHIGQPNVCLHRRGAEWCSVRPEVRAAKARCCDNCLHAEPAVVLGNRDRADRNSRWLLAQ